MQLRPLLFVLLFLTGPLNAAGTRPLLLSSSYAAANTYYIAYFDFFNGAAQTVPNNAFLEFDIFIPDDSADFSGSLDFYGGAWPSLRDYTTASGVYIRDQNYLRAHPFSDLAGHAKGQWYHRKFDMGALAGQTFTEVCLTSDTGNNSNGSPSNLAGLYNAYFNNIRFTNAYGAPLLELFSNATSLPMSGSPVVSITPFGGAGAATAANNRVAVTESLSLAVSAPTATAGSALTLTATLLGPAFTAIQGAKLRLTSNRAQDSLSLTLGGTNAAGQLSATVSSTVAGPGQVLVTAGPFSAMMNYSFSAAAASAWRLRVANRVFVVSDNATSLQVAAKDAFGNATGTARAVRLASADVQLQLSLDGIAWVSAAAGITLTPSAGPAVFYARNNGGIARGAVLNATDLVGGIGALAADSDSLWINPAAATGLTLSLPAGGTAGTALLLSATAVDSGGRPAASEASVALNSASGGGSFSLDKGNTWASTTSVALADGGIALLYRDTRTGGSLVSAASALGPAGAVTTITAGAPALVSGNASPASIRTSSGAPNHSVLSTFVSDVYGNPVSGTTVSFAVAAGGGSLSSASAATNAGGSAASTFSSAIVATNANYIRASVVGIKPFMFNVPSSNPIRLNLAPEPATGGVDVPTQFTVLAQDASTPAITGYSTSLLRISSTTGTMSFSADGVGGWGPSADVALSAGRAVFYAQNSSPTGVAGATITATDLSSSLATGVAHIFIFQAALQVFQVSSPAANVSRNENGVTVVMTVRNQGGTDSNLSTASLSFNGSSSGFSVTPLPGNPAVVPAGGSAQLLFSVNVGAAAPLGNVTLNGSVSGSDSVTGAVLNDNGSGALTGQWRVAGPATQLRLYAPGGTPPAGAPFSVSVVALDASGNTVTVYSQALTVSTRLNASPGVTASGQVNLAHPAFAAGIARFDSYYTVASQGVFLRADSGSLSAAGVGFTPTAAALERYRVYNPPSALLGQPFSVTISAMDAYGNTRGGAGALTLTADGGSGSLTVAWRNLLSGLISFSQAYDRSELIRILADDGSVSSVLAETTPIAVISYTHTVSPTFTVSRTFTLSPTFSVSPTVTETFTVSPSFSVTPTDTDTTTGTPTTSASPTPSASPTATPTGSPSSTPSETPTASATPTGTPTFSHSHSPTRSTTFTESPTASHSATQTPTHSHSSTATVSASITRTPTESPSVTPTGTATATRSSTPSSTRTATPSATRSESTTATPSATGTGSRTHSPSTTPTHSITPTFSHSPTRTPSPSITPTFTHSPTATLTATATPSRTAVTQPVLSAPWPNPFRPLQGQHLNLRLGVSVAGTVRVRAYNLAGELVRRMHESQAANGTLAVTWDGRNDQGDTVASGTYLILAETPSGPVRTLVAVIK